MKYPMIISSHNKLQENSLKSLTPPESSTYLIKTFTPSIGDIVGSTKTDGLQAQGNHLERACATSLWARYRKQSQAGEFAKLQDVVPSWPKDNQYVCISILHLISPRVTNIHRYASLGLVVQHNKFKQRI